MIARYLTLSLIALLLASLPVMPAIAQHTVLAEYDFDSPAGGPDPQGWRPLHRLQSTEEVFGHVDDVGGLGPTLAPLAGSQSFWFGLSALDPRTCGWIQPPGYGSFWSEQLRSVPFAVTGDVTLSFLIDVGIETGYDNLGVQYLGASGDWEDLWNFSCTWDDCVALQQSFVIPAAEHAGTLSIRFFFNSEFVGDARQPVPPFTVNLYGVLLDDITLIDAGGLVDSQDFESESVGDQASTDGDWIVELVTDMPHGGFLADGDDVVQLPAVTNTSNMWGFFDGSPHDWGCAGYPDQATVDETHAIVRSPRIDITHDVYGNPVVGGVDSILVEFDLYAEVDISSSKTYQWQVLAIDLDCPGQPSLHSGGTYDAPAGWMRERLLVIPPAGTDEIEIELGLRHGVFIPSWCPTHAPLYDNVKVTLYGDVVTAVEVPIAPTRLEQNYPNPFNPRTSIRFSLAARSLVSLDVYNVAGRRVRSLLTEELYESGPHARVWDGRDDDGRTVAGGVYFYRLKTPDEVLARRMTLLK